MDLGAGHRRQAHLRVGPERRRRASLPCPSFPSWSWHWSELGLNPKAGLEFGLDLAVADKEGVEKPVSTDWAGLPRFDLPAHWGTATLGE